MPTVISSPPLFSSSFSAPFLAATGAKTRQQQQTLPPFPASLSKPRGGPQSHFLVFEIHNFAGLSHPKGSFIETRAIETGNHSVNSYRSDSDSESTTPVTSWYLRVYPRGHGRSRSDKVLVSCFLRAGGDGDINDGNNAATPNQGHDFEFSFRIKNWRMPPRRCGFRRDLKYGFMGHTREAILEKGLDANGTLVVGVEVRFSSRRAQQLQLKQPQPQQTNAFYPSKKRRIQARGRIARDESRGAPLARELYRSLEFADLAFLVGNTVFRAHRCVLAVRSRTLLELVEPDGDDVDDDDDGNSNDKNTPVSIPGVDEAVFGAFLEYVYTSNEESLLWFLKNNPGSGGALLVLADKFGATDLKLRTESLLVDSFLSLSNGLEMLLLADSHYCGLLKEAALEVCASDLMSAIRNGRSSGGGDRWAMVKESPKLMEELLLSCSGKIRALGLGGNELPLQKRDSRFHPCRTVRALRDALEEAGLDPDGSREILVRRWNQHQLHTRQKRRNGTTQRAAC
mmetsp:Transcript_13135/g.27780  ORF Transcript_13135/g.27780 Transcript_13135/m.27780 type:complete len:512 (+) Transcript_13135:269-1804(+)|eukprot:CAMPEP_0201127530 /NCGR_PEP_ID=MMETSP0850-20130426/30616_1 /ASSEMBLY_ACC=CAM_ASM_000622 /TAXON_ID=183588 /ORGANISM="Pseudo-nitzschia fraudulenta, Strain WWA7" /LENGTH=511 /DNA_ID=CAMNT_0047396417 /DNA_START=159 /DNA_END=1697 /DNA_ORIENTATION=+